MAVLDDGAATAPGYHLARIERGAFGEASKVREEFEELLDAEAQGVRLMALVELSDLVGAIGGYVARHHAGADLAALPDPAPEARPTIGEAVGILVEAEEERNPDLALAAAAALLASVGRHLARSYPGVTMADLEAMSEVTQRAFRNGRRSPSPAPAPDSGDRTVGHHQV